MGSPMRPSIQTTSAEIQKIWVALGVIFCLLVINIFQGGGGSYDSSSSSSLLHVEVQSQKVAVNGAQGGASVRTASTGASTGRQIEVISTTVGGPRLITAGEMKRSMKLPCNYVHDGFFIRESNEVLNQVYQTLEELEDDDVPVLIECGGHDGITKSLSLKSSICLNMNTLLIEASPVHYNVLSQSRPYDFTVNAALCNGDSLPMEQEEDGVYNVQCTSIDKELDRLKSTLPFSQQDKLKLIFLVLDVDGHESTAIDGIQKYKPAKVLMGISHTKKVPGAMEKIDTWATSHALELTNTNGNDNCYNCQTKISLNFQPGQEAPWLRKLLYGARHKYPTHNVNTALVQRSYYYYGE